MIAPLRTALSLALFLASATAASQPAPGSPRQWVETRHGAVMRLIRQPAAPGTPQGEQRNAQVSRILNGMLDVEELARRALEPHWEGRSPAERSEFVGLLRQLIERNYRENLDSTANYSVTWEPERLDDGGTGATVRSVARSRTDARAAAVSIEYRMLRREGRWVVYDLVTNNASLVETYHDAYTRIVRERGFPELLRRLRARAQATGGIAVGR